ncbi:Glucosamine inositolphosphorylceramide transferase [Thalictrum thalictroides]|uniref:Glucosamine inositolphosphorylceramide transferase n=1 Tax=Thalictrum thalictroides TaxID=46969 RepID=A0A7J6V5K1_THATH|nr:Glucosamine inositolphosphorylceramide transferase [Thalictrum thalictroides]
MEMGSLFCFSPSHEHPLFGCQHDSEASWCTGVFYRVSPFSLKPIEANNVRIDDNAASRVANLVVTCASVSEAGFPSNFVADPFLCQKYVRIDDSAAWPVASSVVTCASVSEADFPVNFVADPFLYVQGDILYLFYETKISITLQGDIGVSKSSNKGATWQQLHLGMALDED